MSLRVTTKISQVDEAISALLERRRRCTDPIEILLATEVIDMRLDERLVLMRDRDHQPASA